MGMFKRYAEYLKDNPEGYWFKRKLFGWGWTPARWQGWVLTFALVAFMLWRTIAFETSVRLVEPTEEQLYRFFFEIIGSVVLFVVIAWRTGESPKWQWGLPKDSEK